MDKTLSTRPGSNETVSTLTKGGPKQVLLGDSQRLAMEWLMGGGSITEAGQYAGVCRQTVSDWLHNDDDFRQVFSDWQLHLRVINHARLIALSASALDTVSHAIRQNKDAK